MAKLPAEVIRRVPRNWMANTVAWARGRKRADLDRTRLALQQAIAAAEAEGGDVRLSPEFARTLATELEYVKRSPGRPVASIGQELRHERLRQEYWDMRQRGVSELEARAEVTRQANAEGELVSEEAVKKWVHGGG